LKNGLVLWLTIGFPSGKGEACLDLPTAIGVAFVGLGEAVGLGVFAYPLYSLSLAQWVVALQTGQYVLLWEHAVPVVAEHPILRHWCFVNG
jgi:hypothetical protein